MSMVSSVSLKNYLMCRPQCTILHCMRMNQFHGLELLAFLLLLLSITPLLAAPSPDPGSAIMDTTIRDCAFKALHHRRSGVPYQIPLPAGLSSIASFATRTGSRDLWTAGANLAALRIPPRALPVPFVRRLALVYENLGDCRYSSAYYRVPGYSLVAPVVGLLAYNASDAVTEVDLDVFGDPILITFPGPVELVPGSALRYCAKFKRNGSVQIGGTVGPDRTCSTSGCGGVVGLGLLGLVGTRIFRLFRERRVRGREVRAEEGEALDWVWVGKGSKMPSAAAMRTKPVLEISSTP